MGGMGPSVIHGSKNRENQTASQNMTNVIKENDKMNTEISKTESLNAALDNLADAVANLEKALSASGMSFRAGAKVERSLSGIQLSISQIRAAREL